jgi:hypothetical protein
MAVNRVREYELVIYSCENVRCDMFVDKLSIESLIEMNKCRCLSIDLLFNKKPLLDFSSSSFSSHLLLFVVNRQMNMSCDYLVRRSI